MSKTTLLVDGNAVAYTININNCVDEKEFFKTFLSRLREYAKQFPSMPRALLFFDDKSENWREKLYPDYQKGRKEAKNKCTQQQLEENKKRSEYINYIKNCFSKSKYDYIHYPHTETDDLISLYCNNLQKDDEKVIILTTDKDLFQLIRDKENKKVYVLFLIKRKLIKDEKQGKEALQNKIWLGDNSDSIPGVCKNVGKVTFPDFIKFLRTMKENNVDPTDKIKAKEVCEKLNVKYMPTFSNFSKKQLELNRKLINLNYVVELDKEENNVKTNYLLNTVEKAKFSPYALLSIKSV